MTEEGHLDQFNVRIDEWRPTTPEAAQEFFNSTVPQLRALKTRHLKDLSAAKPFSDEHMKVRLDYLERRLHALQPGDVVYLGKIDDRIVGFVLVRWDEQEQRTKIEQFYVDPRERSKGIGTNVLKKAFEQARQTRPGVSKGIFLSTGKGEENKARRLYERMGFHVSAAPGDISEEDRFDLDFETEQKSV